MLDRIAEPWEVTAVSVPPRQKILPLGPIARTVADRLLVVGDAAGLVKPTTGGGIYYSLMSAALAADAAVPALRRNRLTAADLSDYERRWRDRLDDELGSQQTLRKIAERMSDGEIDALFDLARTDGIIPLVRRTASFNQHRHLIRALLQHPPARRVLLRAMVG
jgi:flavin-dependent dehydrogenase